MTTFLIVLGALAALYVLAMLAAHLFAKRDRSGLP
jgi:hypothetical protein